MAEKTVAQKGHIKPGSKINVVNGVDSVVASLGLPDGTEFVDLEHANLAFLFVHTRQELNELFPPLAVQLRPGMVIWVFFQKGAADAGLDMSRNDVWEVADRAGLRPMGLVSVDERWSGFRLRPA